jgi:hypothetical protein
VFRPVFHGLTDNAVAVIIIHYHQVIVAIGWRCYEFAGLIGVDLSGWFVKRSITVRGFLIAGVAGWEVIVIVCSNLQWFGFVSMLVFSSLVEVPLGYGDQSWWMFPETGCRESWESVVSHGMVLSYIR